MARSKKKEEKVEQENILNEEQAFLEIRTDERIEIDENGVHTNPEQRYVEKQLALQHILNSRRSAYPNLLEQIEALWLAHKGDDSEFKRIDAIINEVKAKYPKPENLEIKNEEGDS